MLISKTETYLSDKIVSMKKHLKTIKCLFLCVLKAKSHFLNSLKFVIFFGPSWPILKQCFSNFVYEWECEELTNGDSFPCTLRNPRGGIGRSELK